MRCAFFKLTLEYGAYFSGRLIAYCRSPDRRERKAPICGIQKLNKNHKYKKRPRTKRDFF